MAAVDAARSRSAIAAARDRLAAVKPGDDVAAIRNATLALDQATRRFAELMMDAAVIDRHARQDNGRSRRRTGRGRHRASSHGAGGVQMIAVVGEIQAGSGTRRWTMSEAKHKRHSPRQAGARHLSCPRARRLSLSSAQCPTTITASRCRFSTWRRTSASFSTTPAAASAPAPPATCGSRIRTASARPTTMNWTAWTWPPTSS